MKMIKRTLAIALAGIISVTALCGCNKKQTTSADGVKEYTFFITHPTNAYSPDMPVWKEAESRTGVRLISTVSEVNSDGNVAYTTMLAGKKLPDIIRYNVTELRKLAGKGGLVALDELIEEHAPNIKDFFEKRPDAKKLATVNGKVYFIPGMLYDIDAEAVPTMGLWIRQDWLDKLGLKQPTTIEEYHDVLYAFATKDPNGNGLKDEVPFFDRHNSIRGLLQLYCTDIQQHLTSKGEIEFGPVTENYKAAMKEFAKWYKEGLIDKEYATRTSVREQLLGQNLGGSCLDWFASTATYNDTLKDTVPGINFISFLPPKDIEGNVASKFSTNGMHNSAWGISKDADKDELVNLIKYLDFWMSEEGSFLRNYGVEGVSYTKNENGEIEWTKEALEHTSGIPNFLGRIGGFELGTRGSTELQIFAMNDIGKAGFELNSTVAVPALPTLSFTDEEQQILNKYLTNITTAVQEQMQKWLYGSEDVDATWDKYIETLEGMGVREIIKVYEAAYERAIGK